MLRSLPRSPARSRNGSSTARPTSPACRLDRFPTFDEALRSLDPEAHWWASVRLDLEELLFGTRVADSPIDPDPDSMLGRLRAGLDADDPTKRSALAAAVKDYPDLVAPIDAETASATRHQVREG